MLFAGILTPMSGDGLLSAAMKRTLLAFLLAAAAFAHARDDQLWLNYAVNASPWDNGVMLHFDQEIEVNYSQLTDEETYMSAGYMFCDYVSVHVGYRVLRERGAEGHLVTEHRPTADICLYAPEFWTLRFSHRSRFEYRDRSHVQPNMRYRERFQLATSWSVTDYAISPYTSVEVFFSDKSGISSSEVFDCMRSQVGFTFVPWPAEPRLKCAMYFMAFHFVSNGARDWDPLNVYGFDIWYDF